MKIGGNVALLRIFRSAALASLDLKLSVSLTLKVAAMGERIYGRLHACMYVCMYILFSFSLMKMKIGSK